jgi:hypothetical protein
VDVFLKLVHEYVHVLEHPSSPADRQERDGARRRRRVLPPAGPSRRAGPGPRNGTARCCARSSAARSRRRRSLCGHLRRTRCRGSHAAAAASRPVAVAVRRIQETKESPG